jgi:hypothetical protein
MFLLASPVPGIKQQQQQQQQQQQTMQLQWRLCSPST